MENNKKEYGIFESVEFLNEGTGTVIFGIYFGFIAAIGVTSAIIDAATKSKIRKVLKRIEKDNNDIKDLKANKLKKIILISDDTLIKDAKLNDKAKTELDAQGKYAVCAGAYDYNDKLIAYSIFDKDSSHYGINFIDKSLNEKQQIYIGANFELKFGRFGKNVEDLIEKKSGTFGPMYGWINRSDKKEFDKYKPAGVSQEEFDKIHKAMDTLANKIASHLKAKFKSAEVNIQDIDGDIYVATYNEYHLNTTDVTWAESNYQKYFDEVESILEKEKFEFRGNKDRYAVSSDPKWTHIRVSSNWGDDYDGFEIRISCTKDIEV